MMHGGRRHESTTVCVALGWRSRAAADAAAVPGDEPRAPPLAWASFPAALAEPRRPESGSVPAAPGGFRVPVTVTEAVPVPAVVI